MGIQKIIAVLLLIAGALALGYGGFNFTTETHTAKIGSLEVSVDEKRQVNVPVWGGFGMVFVGGLLLLVAARR